MADGAQGKEDRGWQSGGGGGMTGCASDLSLPGIPTGGYKCCSVLAVGRDAV